jgi:hypothetical protein
MICLGLSCHKVQLKDNNGKQSLVFPVISILLHWDFLFAIVNVSPTVAIRCIKPSEIAYRQFVRIFELLKKQYEHGKIIYNNTGKKTLLFMYLCSKHSVPHSCN